MLLFFPIDPRFRLLANLNHSIGIMSEVSVIPAPPGVTVDFDHPRQQKVLEHYLLFGVGGTIAFIALCQRFYTKLFLSKGLQVDDGEFVYLG